MAVHYAGKYACIEEFIVNPNSRGKGVGGRRFEAAVARATEGGCYEIQPSRPSDRRAVSTYMASYPVTARSVLDDKVQSN